MTDARQDVTINGQAMAVPIEITVTGLLAHLGVAATHVAVEQNRKLVARQDYASAAVRPGDQFEIVTFVGGG